MEPGTKLWERALSDLNPVGAPYSFQSTNSLQNIQQMLKLRECGNLTSNKASIRTEEGWLEQQSAIKHSSRYSQLPDTTKSTISIAISPNGKLFASTHGDHTVKIICYETGRILQTLVGHPRTPWSVKFHPTNSRFVASGCLGFQVRFWDIESGRCLYVTALRHAIISISFHPSGDILAIASGTCVYTWDYQHSCPRIAMFSYQTLRSVTFLPDHSKILVGEANERYNRPQGHASSSDLTVTITLWDFDPTWALSTEPSALKKAMHNSRVVLSHALIYNDGGFDISKCGRYLAICADLSLRQAEKELEMEAINDLEQILAHDSVQDGSSSNDEVNQVPIPRISVHNAIPSIQNVALPTLPQHHSNNRSRQMSLPSLQTLNTVSMAHSASFDFSSTMDEYMNQHFRRVRARLQQTSVQLHRQYPFGMARSPGRPQLVSQGHPQIRPNIALSRLRFSRAQRAQRYQLASEVQSTWLTLISLEANDLGKIIQTCHLAETLAGGVTSVKISPGSAYALLGYGVRDRMQRENMVSTHRVTRIYRWDDMKLLSHVESDTDDVNIALFNPIPGGGFIYGTKQGKLRVCKAYRGDYDDDENCNVFASSRRLHFDPSDSNETSGNDRIEDMDELEPALIQEQVAQQTQNNSLSASRRRRST